jgi:hypothetical protein
VREIGLRDASDPEIFRRARVANAVVMTKDRDFIRLARGLEQGPGGLAAVFQRIGPEHQLDGHFLYQQRVRRWALARLQRNPDDRDALWSLALLATLNNRPVEASRWYGRLQALEPGNPWPAAYRAVVSLADHRGWPVPICRQVVDLLEARVDPREAVRALMERDLRPEAGERQP